jgi:hypothetical protein
MGQREYLRFPIADLARQYRERSDRNDLDNSGCSGRYAPGTDGPIGNWQSQISNTQLLP